MINWNHERIRTRDRLLDFDMLIPHNPKYTHLPFIYPWENLSLTLLDKQIFDLARTYGYTGTPAELWEHFSSTNIYTMPLEDFPLIGEEDTLYLDTDTDTLYYFKTSTIYNVEEADANGVFVRSANNIYYLYIPIRALLIENVILDSSTP